MIAPQLLFNGHAGAGLGELLAAAGIIAFAASAVIFAMVYRARPAAWLRMLGMFYVLSAIILLVASVVYFGPIALLLLLLTGIGLLVAICLGIGHLLSAQRTSSK